MEEVGMSIHDDGLQEVARLTFYNQEKKGGKPFRMMVYVYFAQMWGGKPKESKELKPKWFRKTELPYDKMWEPDKIWLPLVMSGTVVKASFWFDEESKLVQHKIGALKPNPL